MTPILIIGEQINNNWILLAECVKLDPVDQLTYLDKIEVAMAKTGEEIEKLKGVDDAGAFVDKLKQVYDTNI